MKKLNFWDWAELAHIAKKNPVKKTSELQLLVLAATRQENEKTKTQKKAA